MLRGNFKCLSSFILIYSYIVYVFVCLFLNFSTIENLDKIINHLSWGASVVRRMYSSNPDFYPLGASSTFPNHDCQKHLQTLSNVPWVAKSSWLRKTGLGHYVANLFCSRSNLVLLLISQLFSFVLKVSIVLHSVYELLILVSKYICIFVSIFFISFIGNVFISSKSFEIHF